MKGERTFPVTYFSMFQVVGAVLGLVFLVAKPFNTTWHSYYQVASLLLTGLLTYGLWRMQRWAFYGFVFLFVAKLGIMLTLQQWSWASMILAAAFAIVWLTSFRFAE